MSEGPAIQTPLGIVTPSPKKYRFDASSVSEFNRKTDAKKNKNPDPDISSDSDVSSSSEESSMGEDKSNTYSFEGMMIKQLGVTSIKPIDELTQARFADECYNMGTVLAKIPCDMGDARHHSFMTNTIASYNDRHGTNSMVLPTDPV